MSFYYRAFRDYRTTLLERRTSSDPALRRGRNNPGIVAEPRLELPTLSPSRQQAPSVSQRLNVVSAIERENGVEKRRQSLSRR